MEDHIENTFDTQIRDLVHTVYKYYGDRDGDLINLRTLNLKFLGQVMKALGLTWTQVTQIYKNQIPVHPEIAREFLNHGDEEMESVLAQGFVRNDKLIRIVKQLSSHEDSIIDELLAVDGLLGNISNGPNFEHKYYINNLRFGLIGPKSDFDEEPDYKRLHAQAVRRMYVTLRSRNIPQQPLIINTLLHQIIKDTVNVELPSISDNSIDVNEELLEECKDEYFSIMHKKLIHELVKSLRRRGEKRTASNEDVEIHKSSKQPSEENII